MIEARNAIDRFFNNNHPAINGILFSEIYSASPQSTLIISKLKNKYPKKYPKRAFSGTFFVMA